MYTQPSFSRNVMRGKVFPRGCLGGYTFAFNGKEKVDEAYGEGNLYDYGFRIYDPRIARFLSVDPLFQSFPWYTPYQFSGNMPIWCIDLDGLEDVKATKKHTVEIWEAGQKLPDGTPRTIGFETYTAGSKVTQQGEEGGDTWNYVVKISGTQNGPHISERWIKEDAAPQISMIDLNDTDDKAAEASSTTTAASTPPPIPPSNSTSTTITTTQATRRRTTPPNPLIPARGRSVSITRNLPFQNNRSTFANASNTTTTLTGIANTLLSNPNLRLLIAPNIACAECTGSQPLSDPTGVDGNNNGTFELLMQKRGSAVYNQLIQMGVPAGQMSIGKGEFRQGVYNVMPVGNPDVNFTISNP